MSRSAPAHTLASASGGVTTGIGCAFAATSPGTSLAGKVRSSTGWTGFPVTRSRMNIRLFFETTATAGIDYVSTNGTLTFLPGQTSKTITVGVLGDVLDNTVRDPDQVSPT